MKYTEKSNNELLQIVNNIQVAHSAMKIKMLKGLDELEQLEREFKKINNVLKTRLNGSS